MGIFDDAVEAMFASDVAYDATYTPIATGVAQTIRVVPSRDDGMASILSTTVKSTRAVFEIKSADVAEPKKGDLVTLASDGSIYEVKYARRIDDDRLIWFLDCVPQ